MHFSHIARLDRNLRGSNRFRHKEVGAISNPHRATFGLPPRPPTQHGRSSKSRLPIVREKVIWESLYPILG